VAAEVGLEGGAAGRLRASFSKGLVKSKLGDLGLMVLLVTIDGLFGAGLGSSSPATRQAVGRSGVP
jgi:hypothetical protein